MPRAFWIVVAIVFFSNAGFSSHAAFFSLYVTDMLPGFLVSIAWSIGAIAEIPAMLYGGRLIRRFGVRAMLVTATLAQVVRLVLYAVAPQTGPVLAAQLLHVFTFGLLHTAGIGFVSRTIAPGSRARAVALYNAIGFGLPGLLGGVLGGQLLEAFGFSTLFLAFAALPFAGSAIGVFAGKPIGREAG
jgi:PPP family 3-phenylpropionic acid transporter